MTTQQTSGRVPRPVATLAIAVVVVVGASIALYALANVGHVNAPVRGYTEFLDDVAAGQVTSVEQTGDTLTVTGPAGPYEVVAPSILTNVYGDMQAAADAAGVPLPENLYSATSAPEPSWPEILLTMLIPLALLAVVFAAVIILFTRRGGGGPDAKRRLSALDAAWRDGLITDEERARKRAQIIEAI